MSSEDLASAKQLGRFRLDRRLALGGMAEIWLADEESETGEHREVALKILLAPYAKDPTFRGMFADEVHIASRLTHENIVQVYGAYEIDGHLLQSMEIVDGRDLRRVLSALARGGESFPIPLALLITREIARALFYAHTKKGDDGNPLKIVHRDVSPHNVMITRGGHVKVLDFGIASAAERLTRTRTGVIKGKIAYMAPEQALAMAVTAQTDIFALGIVLWEMLAMQRLFKAESDAVILERVVKAEVPPIRDFNAAVPEDAAVLLAHMLQQRANNRPETMRYVENALTRILMRHFREEQISTHALAAWVTNWLEIEPKKTGRYLAPELELEPAPETPTPSAAEPRPSDPDPDPPTKSDISNADRTEAMQAIDKLGASGGTSIGEASARPTPREEFTQPDQSFADPTIRLAPIDPQQAKEKDTDRVRLPTKSEIVRAIDAVATTPLIVDPSVLAAPVGLPRVSDPDTERDLEQKSRHVIRVPAEGGRVSSGKVVGGEAQLPPSRSLKSVLEAPTLDPSGPHPGAGWPDVPDDRGFAPVKVGFTDAIRALDPAARRSDAVPTEPTAPPRAATPRWVYPTLALLFVLIVVLLGLLVMKDG